MLAAMIITPWSAGLKTKSKEVKMKTGHQCFKAICHHPQNDLSVICNFHKQFVTLLFAQCQNIHRSRLTALHLSDLKRKKSDLIPILWHIASALKSGMLSLPFDLSNFQAKPVY